jgi:acyl dehydratase
MRRRLGERMDLEQQAGEQLCLEDLAVGQTFQSGTYRMQVARIKAFAAEFDPQPFHLDEAAAEQSLFRGLAASGWHTAAVTMKLLTSGGLPFANGLIGLGGELAWPSPTRPGDILQVTSEVLGIVPSRSKPDRGVVTVRSVTRNQNGDAVYIFTAKILAFRRNRATLDR